MCPSIGASEDASSMAPITIKMNGQVLEKSNMLPRTSCSRNNTPMVISTAGPISPRIVHLGHRQPVLFAMPASLPSAQSITEHQNSQHNQQHRPELLNPPPREPVKVVQQQQNSDPDNQKWSNRFPLAEIFQRIIQPLPCQPRLRSAIRIDRHINPQRGDADPQRCFRPAANRPVHAHDEEKQKNRQVDDSFAILLVVESAKPWQKSQKKRQQWTRAEARGNRRAGY